MMSYCYTLFYDIFDNSIANDYIMSNDSLLKPLLICLFLS